MAQFLARWKELADHCYAHEPNTLTYELSISESEADTVIIYERYPTKSELDDPHTKSASFIELNKWMEQADIVDDKEVTSYRESNIGYHVK